MSFREDFDYHVMNNYSGKLVYSTNDPMQAENKAKDYCANSGYTHTVLLKVRAFRVKRVIEEVEE